VVIQTAPSIVPRQIAPCLLGEELARCAVQTLLRVCAIEKYGLTHRGIEHARGLSATRILRAIIALVSRVQSISRSL